MALVAVAPAGQVLLDGRRSTDILGFELRVRLRALDENGVGGSAFVERVGIIDTGASHVHIDRRIAKELGLRARDKRPAEIASGEQLFATVYNGLIEAPELGVALIAEFFSFEDQPSGAKILAPSSRVLIGRSFLRHFLIAFDGPSGIVTFGRPTGHYGPIDDE